MPRGTYVTCKEAKRMTELRERGLSFRAIGRIVGRRHTTVLYVEKRAREIVILGARRG